MAAHLPAAAVEPYVLALLIPIVAILAGTYKEVVRTRAKAADLGDATGDLRRSLAEARADRDRLRARIEALEAIVTDDGFDLARDARRAGLDLDALPDPRSDAAPTARTRTR